MIEQVFLTNQKLEMNMPQIFKTKCIVNFRKYRNRKKGLDLREQKWQNQMKLKKMNNWYEDNRKQNISGMGCVPRKTI